MSRRARLVALLMAFLGAALLSPSRGAAAALPLYTVDAMVEYGSGVVEVRETLAFVNQSSQTLETLVFSVTPAHYGAFQLLRATVNAQEVEATLEDSLLELPLPQPLPPGASAVATLDFRLQVPWQGGRFGRGPQVMALGNWLPLLAIYRDGRLLAEGQEGGWVRGRYVEVGDAFFSQAADFLVTLRADRTLTVAHTGDLVDWEETLWRFEARGVRDFALALSPSFATLSQEVGGVEVTVFYLPGHRAAAGAYLQAAAEMLAWLSQTLIPYPYRHLHLAEVNAQGSTMVGQEYPNLIFLDNSGPAGISVALTDTIPAGASYISATVWGGAVYSPTLDSILWSGTVPSGLSSLPSQIFSFRVRVDDRVSRDAITNTVTVSDGSTTVMARATTPVWRRTFVGPVLKETAGW